MIKNETKKNMKLIIIYLLYLFFIVVWYNNYTINNFIFDYSKDIFKWIIIGLIINFTSFLAIKKVEYNNLTLWFVGLSYFFMYGDIFIKKLKWNIELDWNPILYYSDEVLFKSAYYINLCLLSLTLGSLLMTSSSDKNLSFSKKCNKSKYRIGLILMIIGFLSNLFTAVKIILVTQSVGSYGVIDVDTTGIMDDLGFLFIPGVLYLLYSKKLNKKKTFFIIFCTILYFLFYMLLSGNRKIQIFSIISLILAYMKMKNYKINIKRLFFIGIGSVFFLDIIYIIREYRTNLNVIFQELIKSFVNFDIIKKLIGESILEMGISFCSVASIITCVPSIFDYELGKTFLRTIPSCLPIGWLFPNFFSKATSTFVINNYMKLPVGDSLLGDFFWNFGWGGILIAFLFGILLGKISKNFYLNKEEVYFSLFFTILPGVRTGFFELFRPIVIVTMVPLILRYILNFKLLKKGRKLYESFITWSNKLGIY